jgi:hypothetical protein
MNLLTFLAVGVIGFVAYDVWKKSNMPTKTKTETKQEEEDDTSFMSSGLFDSDCPKLANSCPTNKY